LYQTQKVLFFTIGDKVYFGFIGTTNFSIDCNQMNYWTKANQTSDAGTITDTPSFSWRKLDKGNINLTANANPTSTTIVSNNFTTEDLAAMPPLAELRFQTAEVLSMGNLPLINDEVNIGDTYVTGETLPGANILVMYNEGGQSYSLKGTADSTGKFDISLPNAITSKVAVEIYSNIPFLHTVNRVEQQLYFLQVPQSLPFVFTVVNTNPTMMGRGVADWTISVYDSRNSSSNWHIYARLENPLTSSSGYQLRDALVFVDSNGNATPVENNSILIYTGSGNNGIPKTINISWSDNRGFLLRILPNNPIRANEVYTAELILELVEA
jgi:hypothetical protein